MGELYSGYVPSFVYRIYDPVEKKFCASGHSLYGKGRSIWMNSGSANLALKYMPEDIQERLVIKKFKLVEVKYY